MKVRKKSATFLFGVIFLGLSSSMVLGATDVLGDVGSQAIDDLESQVNKENGNNP